MGFPMAQIHQISHSIPVGISACLLGEKVRYDGGHKHSKLCSKTLGEYFSYRPICPEVAIGLGTPRETIRIVFDKDSDRTAVQNQAGTVDHYEALRGFADHVVKNHADLCGYIVMKGSPSCGYERIKRFNLKGNLQDTRGVGAFTERLQQLVPWLPVEESGRLNDPFLKENFVLRVMCLELFKRTVEAQLSAKALIDFHATHKYLLMAHSQAAYRELGQLLSSLKNVNLEELAITYRNRFMAALAKPATKKGHVNALMHMQGYLKRDLQTPDKQRLNGVITQYRNGELPLSAPMTLLQFLLEQYPNDYILQQRYLSPYPSALGLRNAI